MKVIPPAHLASANLPQSVYMYSSILERGFTQLGQNYIQCLRGAGGRGQNLSEGPSTLPTSSNFEGRLPVYKPYLGFSYK